MSLAIKCTLKRLLLEVVRFTLGYLTVMPFLLLCVMGEKKGADFDFFDFFDFINAVKMMFAAPDVWVFYFVLMLGMSSPTLIELKTQIDKSKKI